jgi:hypothetical protein
MVSAYTAHPPYSASRLWNFLPFLRLWAGILALSSDNSMRLRGGFASDTIAEVSGASAFEMTFILDGTL